MQWTEDRVERLKQLWAEGLSASRIAAELGGITRNAVIGKVHRLGLSGRVKSSSGGQPRPRRPRAERPQRSSTPATAGNTALKIDPKERPRPVAEPVPLEELVIPISERATILSLTETTCKWPIGDPGHPDFHFCGRKADTGIPYCAHHARIAYQPASDRRRERRAAGR